MKQVKEIEQLKRKEQILENINSLQEKRLKRDAGMPMLVVAAITGVLGIILFTSLFRSDKR